MRRPLGILLAAAVTFLAGAILVVRFFYYFVRDPAHSGHVQSLTLGVACVIVSVLFCAFAVLADLLSVNRHLLDEVRERVGRLGARADDPRSEGNREAGDGPGYGASTAARTSEPPGGRLLRGPGHAEPRTLDSADRKVR
jgi:membrane carboxypeptidase/penicillin-binding protein